VNDCVFARGLSEAGFPMLGADRLNNFDFEEWRSIHIPKFNRGPCLATLVTEWYHSIHGSEGDHVHWAFGAWGVEVDRNRRDFRSQCGLVLLLLGCFLTAMLEVSLCSFGQSDL
jgi:hypothetical protein